MTIVAQNDIVFLLSGDTIKGRNLERSFSKAGRVVTQMEVLNAQGNWELRNFNNLKTSIKEYFCVLESDQIDTFTGSIKRRTNLATLGTNNNYQTITIQGLRVDSLFAFKAWSTIDLGCSGAVGNYILIKFENGV